MGSLNMSTSRLPIQTRRGPQDFFDMAIEMLEAEGFLALTAAGLCDHMGVTRGSFYHHFVNFDGFVDRLLEYWEDRYTTMPVSYIEAIEDTEAKQEQQRRFALLLPHGAEAAIRAWSAVNDRVAIAQRRVDSSRRDSTADHLRRLGLSPEDAELYADLAVSSLIGMELLDSPADVGRILGVLELVQSLVEQRLEHV
jgi:AcrR family transcriptional regulator